MNKPNFHFRILPAKMLAEIIKVPESERGQWVMDLALDLINDDVDKCTTSYAKKIIQETNEYRAKFSKAGKLGGLAKSSNAKASLQNAKAKSSNPLPNSSNSNNNNTYTDDFLMFWDEYPKKVGKGAAFTAWKKSKGKPPVEVIVNSVRDQKKQPQWTKENGQFIPNPQTWINQRRWEDETTPEIEVKQSWMLGG